MEGILTQAVTHLLFSAHTGPERKHLVIKLRSSLDRVLREGALAQDLPIEGEHAAGDGHVHGHLG